MIKLTEKKVCIPTYEIGVPEKNPLFFDKRVYQASSGKIYPYPLIDKIYDEKVDKEYDVVVLENDFIEIMVIPELGGRIHYGLDKVNNYYFFYKNHVIKPALVGLCGPWISGGVEFNWPQHHRPSTYNRVEYDIEKGTDYVIVWVGEIERISQMIGVAGIKIYENSNRVEVIGKSINNTSSYKNFLWWANVAVSCHENYETFFPSDVHYVADHGKREVTSYPIANSQYYNVDYPSMKEQDRNITNYGNIPVPMSYMAVGSKYDFFGGYDFDKKIGTMHVANTNIAPGKKQWTWGNGKFGQAWDRNLTDEDGPYIELMAGVFTDNQPDFTWIAPGETKEFNQTWYPFKEVGKALNANEELAFSLIDKQICIYSTVDKNIEYCIQYEDVKDVGQLNLKVGKTDKVDIEAKILKSIKIDKLVYHFDEKQIVEEFKPAIAAELPEKVISINELYNIGIHLEQYRHATRDPQMYYLEMLKRDKYEHRALSRLGYITYAQGEIKDAKEYFSKAISIQTKYNPNPMDGDNYYGRAICNKYLGLYEESFKDMHKAIWDIKYKAVGNLELAKLKIREFDYQSAFDYTVDSLKYDSTNIQAQTLLEYCKQKLSMVFDYNKLIENNKFNYYARLLTNEESCLNFMAYNNNTILEMLEFLDDINEVSIINNVLDLLKTEHPVIKMFEFINRGSEKCDFEVEGCFPYTLFEKRILEQYISETNCPKAKYLLALLLIDKKQIDFGYKLLEEAYNQGYEYSVFKRTYGLCAYNYMHDESLALKLFKQAINADPNDSRIFYEYDQLLKILGTDNKSRLELLRTKPEFIDYRDDLKIEYANLLCCDRQYEECIKFITSNVFHPFEGGEGKILEIYRTAKIGLVDKLIAEKKYLEAIKILETIEDTPKCLGEDIIDGTQRGDILYRLGYCYKYINESTKSREYLEECINEQVITTSKLSYKPEKLQINYYQAKAHFLLGNNEQAYNILKDLKEYASQKLNTDVEIDYFAISVPEFLVFDIDLKLINRAHCHYLIGLANLGLGLKDEAKEEFEKSYKLCNSKLELSIIESI